MFGSRGGGIYRPDWWLFRLDFRRNGGWFRTHKSEGGWELHHFGLYTNFLLFFDANLADGVDRTEHDNNVCKTP